MSTGISTPAKRDAARTRKRRVAAGAGIGVVGAGLVLLYLATREDDEEDGETPRPGSGGKQGGFLAFTAGAAKSKPAKPKPGTSSKGKGSKGKGSKGKGGKKKPGGNKGPGGGGALDPKRANPGKGSGGKRVNPSGGGTRTNPTPKGPNPKLDDLDRYYNADWPDPGKFYQVGRQDTDGLYGIAWRWFYTCLFLAARNAGGLDDEAARQWAQARVGAKGNAQGKHADVILCVAWNDVLYGSYVVASKNRRGPHGRGIDLVPQHAANWQRLRQGKDARRNIRLGTPGTVGTPSNVGQGDAKLPLLWMPRLDDQRLWDSDGAALKTAGTWADGSSFGFPPPVVMKRDIDDATGSATLQVWGCGSGEGNYG